LGKLRRLQIAVAGVDVARENFLKFQGVGGPGMK
jgi:hypothetical protein